MSNKELELAINNNNHKSLTSKPDCPNCGTELQKALLMVIILKEMHMVRQQHSAI